MPLAPVAEAVLHQGGFCCLNGDAAEVAIGWVTVKEMLFTSVVKDFFLFMGRDLLTILTIYLSWRQPA